MTEYLFARTIDVDVTAAQAAVVAAEAAQAAAEAAQSAAETAQTGAETAETNAETAETNAELAQSGAEAAQSATEAIQDALQTYFLTPKASDPLVDDNGDPLQEGAFYYNTTSDSLKVYNGATWDNYTGASGIAAVVEDTSPQLGGDLDLNGFVILGLEIGTDVQAWDAQLDEWATVDPSDNGKSLVSAADYAAMRALLDLEAGTDFLSPAAIAAAYQPLDELLTEIAALSTDPGADSGLFFDDSANAMAYWTPSTGLEFNNTNLRVTSAVLRTDNGGTLAAATGIATTSVNDGTKSTGTFTPAFLDGNVRRYVNGGAHTLAPPTGEGTMVIQITNDGSAGAITTSGFTFVTGDAFTTTNGHDFMCFITVVNGFSHLHKQALQ